MSAMALVGDTVMERGTSVSMLRLFSASLNCCYSRMVRLQVLRRRLEQASNRLLNEREKLCAMAKVGLLGSTGALQQSVSTPRSTCGASLRHIHRHAVPKCLLTQVDGVQDQARQQAGLTNCITEIQAKIQEIEDTLNKESISTYVTRLESNTYHWSLSSCRRHRWKAPATNSSCVLCLSARRSNSAKWIGKAKSLGAGQPTLLQWITNCLILKLSTKNEAPVGVVTALTDQVDKLKVRDTCTRTSTDTYHAHHTPPPHTTPNRSRFTSRPTARRV